MSIPIGKKMSKKMFVKKAMRQEYLNREKESEQNAKVTGHRTINGRPYTLLTTHRGRSAAETAAKAQGSFTSIQRVSDGWGVFVMDEPTTSVVDKIRNLMKKEEPTSD